MQTETQLNDYQVAKSLINTLKKGKQVTLKVANVAHFRRHLTPMAKDANKKYVTKADGSESVLVIRLN